MANLVSTKVCQRKYRQHAPLTWFARLVWNILEELDASYTGLINQHMMKESLLKQT